MDGEGVGRAGVDTWSVDGAGGALPSEPGWHPTEARDRQGLLRCGLHWVCSLNPRGSWSVSSSRQQLARGRADTKARRQGLPQTDRAARRKGEIRVPRLPCPEHVSCAFLPGPYRDWGADADARLREREGWGRESSSASVLQTRQPQEGVLAS